MKYHFLIRVKYNYQNNASSKPLADCTEIFVRNGYKDLSLDYYLPGRNKLRRLMVGLSLIRSLIVLFFSFKKGDLLAIQYPITGSVSKYLINDYLKYYIRKLRAKGVKCLALVHDTESLRQIPLRPERIAAEIESLNTFNTLIVHNAKMDEWLQTNGLKTQTVLLDAFDYITTSKPREENKILKRQIVFAGGLSKSRFIYNLDGIRTWQFHLYGPAFDDSIPQSNAKWLGEFDSNRIVGELQGNFGLIWDGESIDHLDEPFGNYLKFNNPHKFSLYLAAGLPVIAPADAAIAPFIKSHRIGILVDRLLDLDNIALAADEYQELVQNVQSVRGKITDGYYLGNCITKIGEL